MIETAEDVVVDPETEEDGTTEMIDDIMTDEVRLAEDLSQQLDQIEIPPTIALSSKCDQEALVPDHHREIRVHHGTIVGDIQGMTDVIVIVEEVEIAAMTGKTDVTMIDIENKSCQWKGSTIIELITNIAYIHYI